MNVRISRYEVSLSATAPQQLPHDTIYIPQLPPILSRFVYPAHVSSRSLILRLSSGGIYLQVHCPEGQAHEVPHEHLHPGPIFDNFGKDFVEGFVYFVGM